MFSSQLVGAGIKPALFLLDDLPPDPPPETGRGKNCRGESLDSPGVNLKVHPYIPLYENVKKCRGAIHSVPFLSASERK